MSAASQRLAGTAQPGASRHGRYAHDTAARQVLDRPTRLVTTLLDVPIAMINLVDEERLLFASWANPTQA